MVCVSRLRSLPASWPDIDDADSFVVLARGRTPFRTADLISLVAVVRDLRAAARPKRRLDEPALWSTPRDWSTMFYVDDVQRERDRLKAARARLVMPPTKVTGSTITQVNDTCGDLIQLVTLDRW